MYLKKNILKKIILFFLITLVSYHYNILVYQFIFVVFIFFILDFFKLPIRKND